MKTDVPLSFGIVLLPRSRLAKGIRSYSNLKHFPQDNAGKTTPFLKGTHRARVHRNKRLSTEFVTKSIFVFSQGRFW
jgi:hypothetical protein